MMVRDRNSPSTTAELNWLIHLRWYAGAGILLGSVAHGLAAGWTGPHSGAVVLGLIVLAYNLALWRVSARGGPDSQQGRWASQLAAIQLALDIVVLTNLTLWTGGITSPLLGVFVLHMVLGSLLLPRALSYGVALFAMAVVLAGLSVRGQLPDERSLVLAMVGWGATLLLTVFLTNHISARLRRQESIARDEQRKTQAVLDTAADSIVTIDQRGVIVAANPATERLFGYELDELVGQNISMLMPEPYRSGHDDYLARYLHTGEAKIIGIGRELRALRKDGTLIPIDLAVSEVPLANGRLFTGIMRDISERKRTESELRSLNESLHRHQQALVQQEKMAAMGQMAAGIAHEISNPLASMDSLLQLVQRQPARGTPENVKVLRDQVERISRIVRELTAFAHPSGSGWHTMALSDVIRGSLDMVRFDRRIRNVQVTCDLTEDVQVRVMPQSLQQVLVNMILNALDAMKDVAEPHLSIRTRVEPEWNVIEITDNGHGIPAQHCSRIFEPFFTTKPVGQGTGLGLSISYSLVERHGGRCEVDSTVGEGTTFTIYLPRPAQPATAAGVSCGRESAGAGIPEGGKGTRRS